MNIIASIKTGIVFAEFKVPGNNLSSVCFVNFSKAVWGANAPIPKTSKKLTIKPIIAVFPQDTFSKLSLCFMKSLNNIIPNHTAKIINANHIAFTIPISPFYFLFFISKIIYKDIYRLFVLQVSH